MGLFGKNRGWPDDPAERVAAARSDLERVQAIMETADPDSRRYEKAWRESLAAIAAHDSARVALGQPEDCLTPGVIRGHVSGAAMGMVIGEFGPDGWDNLDDVSRGEFELAASEAEASVALAIELGSMTEPEDFLEAMRDAGIT